MGIVVIGKVTSITLLWFYDGNILPTQHEEDVKDDSLAGEGCVGVCGRLLDVWDSQQNNLPGLKMTQHESFPHFWGEKFYIIFLKFRGKPQPASLFLAACS